MANAANLGTLIGRLAADPKSFLNTDGSKKVLITLYVDRAYKNGKGETISDRIQTEAWIGSQVNGLGPFSYVHQGDLVAVSTHIEQQPYEQNGETVYPAPKIVMDEIKFLESRSTTQARMAKRAVAGNEAAPAAAEAAPAAQAADGSAYDAEADAPFGAPVGV